MAQSPTTANRSPITLELTVTPAGDGYEIAYQRPNPASYPSSVDGTRAVTTSFQAPALRYEAGLAIFALATTDKSEISPENLGAVLFDAVFGGPMGELLANAGSDGRAVQLVLRLAEDQKLRLLPWELMYHSGLGEYLTFAGTSVSRSVPEASSVRAFRETDGPLRVLLVRSDPGGFRPELVPPDPGLAARLDTLPWVEVSELTEASLDSLRDQLARFQPHVLHLMSAIRTGPSGESQLGLQSGPEAHWIAPALLGSALQASNSLGLALATGNIGTSHASAIVSSGPPAAITLQFPLDGRGIETFSTSLYRELGAGATIDAALASARFSLGRGRPTAWAAPVLTVAMAGVVARRLTAERGSAEFPAVDPATDGPAADVLSTFPASAVPASPSPSSTDPGSTGPPDVSPPDGGLDAEVPEGPAASTSEAEPAAIISAAEPVPAAGPVELGTLGGADNDGVGDEDRLGFSYYVDAFADLISSPYTRPPLTIGIFGSWGMGKSFLLEHIEREVTRRLGETPVPEDAPATTAPLRVHVVPFNAWEFSETELVWPGLVRKIVQKLDEEVPWPWHRRYWTRLRWNLPRQLSRSWVPLTSAALAIGAGAGLLFWRDRANLAAALLGIASVLSIGGLVRAASNPVARWVTSLFASSDYGRQIGYMEDIKHDLETLEARLHVDGERSAPVVARILVLVDDLDRCEPAKAVEMLQAVNLLLNFSSFIVCLGIDARIVSGAVEKHYEGLLGEAGASGYEYLDKIVQIPFQIPVPSEQDIKNFIAGQMGNPVPAPTASPAASDAEADPGPAAYPESPAGDSPPAGEVAGPDESAATSEAAVPGRPDAPAPGDSPGGPTDASAPPPEASVPFSYAELQAFEAVARFLRPNPRHLKRLLNIYRLVRALARAKEERVILDNPTATIHWLVLWSQWPYTARVIMDRYDRMGEQQCPHAVSADAGARPLSYLLEQITPGIDRQAQSKFDDSPEILADLLSLPGPAFGWPELRLVRAYTVNLNPAVQEQLPPLPEPSGAATAAPGPAAPGPGDPDAPSAGDPDAPIADAPAAVIPIAGQRP